MLFVKPQNLKPGMILAMDLQGSHGELLLPCGHVLSAPNIAKIQIAEHEGAYIVDCDADLTDDMGLLSKRLRYNAVNALKTFLRMLKAAMKMLKRILFYHCATTLR